jgi:hypothetical protein
VILNAFPSSKIFWIMPLGSRGALPSNGRRAIGLTDDCDCLAFHAFVIWPASAPVNYFPPPMQVSTFFGVQMSSPV